MTTEDRLQPDFSPGAGWHHVSGFATPGSSNDLEKRRERAFHCWVYKLRLEGERLPAVQAMAMRPTQGGLLMMQPAANTPWCAHVFRLPECEVEIDFLSRARIVRESDGCRQYQGFERDTYGNAVYPQTWLCVPSVDKGLSILREMVRREAGRVIAPSV
jgi:hypothetical protein